MPVRGAQEYLLPLAGTTTTSPECLPLTLSAHFQPKKQRDSYSNPGTSPLMANISKDKDEPCTSETNGSESSYAHSFYGETTSACSVNIEHQQQQHRQCQFDKSQSLSLFIFQFAKRIDWNAFQFAIRMAVLLTISSLFVLVRTPTWSYPDGMWVLVSVLFVSWFPSREAASVIEKIIQRLIGTFVGAALGLGLGFLSLALFANNPTQQATFLSFCMFVGNFLIIFVAGQCRVGRVKVIRRFAYSTILCVLTYAICLLPFGLHDDPKWQLGVWRICNVIVGCLLGALGSIAICPKSTSAVLLEKTTKQVRLAGEASEAVLVSASAAFSGRIKVEHLSEELLGTESNKNRWKFHRYHNDLNSMNNSRAAASYNIGADVALAKYEDAIADWKASKALFPLTRYDPFAVVGKAPDEAFHKEVARTLARTLRMQTTIVVLDGMVRNEDAEYADFDQEHFDLFAESGALIRQILSVPLNICKSDEAARQLFRKLEVTRHNIVTLSKKVAGIATVSMSPKSVAHKNGMRDFETSLLDRDVKFQSTRMNDDEGLGIPRYATGCDDNALLFLQLVEHLMLRSLRLYQALKYVELDAIELNDDSIHPACSFEQV